MFSIICFYIHKFFQFSCVSTHIFLCTQIENVHKNRQREMHSLISNILCAGLQCQLKQKMCHSPFWQAAGHVCTLFESIIPFFIMDWGAHPLSSYSLILVWSQVCTQCNLWPCSNSPCVKSIHRTFWFLSLMDANAIGELTVHLMKNHYH